MTARPVDALELEIERAWLMITQKPRALTHVRLTPEGRLIGISASNPTAAGEDVGIFNRNVTLSAFREAVFHTFEGMRRG